jgi:hypothetical protein
MRSFLILGVFAMLLRADSANVPEPPKADLPYLLMAQDLVPTEAFEAKTEKVKEGKKDEETTYWVPGEHSSAKTPLASPIFLMKEDTMAVERLAVYPFEIKNGRREVTFSHKKQLKPYTLTLKKLSDALYRLEVDQSLPPGEYAITPNGADEVYCFAVY